MSCSVAYSLRGCELLNWVITHPKSQLMHDLPIPPDVNNHTLAEVDARQHYFRLREELVSLKSATEPNLAAIDSVIKELEQAQLAYKATYGLFGNNPIDDSAPRTQSSAIGRPQNRWVD